MGRISWEDQVISFESLKRREKMFNVDYKNLQRMKDFPFARIADEYQAEAYKWCQENFGEDWIWSSPILTEYTDIYFLTPEDALLFKLRFDTLATT